ncbi:MAG: ABC transporter ATP-binding protein/permease [Clostridium sp.]|jgi:ABC-type bacteriocin/lantibiotic exporter with double-glycine peptidase domain|nr:ABC transporter ATP-binding protein/permease [Clostridium sp.]
MKRYLLAMKWLLMGDFAFQLLGDMALAFLPISSKELFDRLNGVSDWSLASITALFCSCVAVYILSSYASMLFAWKHSIGLETGIRKDYFRSLLKRPFGRFFGKDIGEYISFQSNDIGALSEDFMPPMINLTKSVLMFFVYAIILVVLIDWRVAMTLLIASIFCTLLTRFTSESLGKSRRLFLDSTARYTAILKDLLSGKKNVSPRTELNFLDKHDHYITEAAKNRYQFGKEKSLSLALNGLFTYAINISAFIVIGALLLQNKISTGSAVASLAYIECFVSPLKDILYDLTAFRSVKETIRKVTEELTQKTSYINDINKSDDKSTFLTVLALNNVSYSNGDFHFLCSYQFHLGKKYAIIGGNGSGKSTLLHLVMKRNTQTSGNITLDGTDIRFIDISYLIGILDQDEHIFASGFTENVTVFGSYDFQQARNMIPQTSLRDKESVICSENLQNTSGGEQRLVGILRLIAQNTPIMLLDEPFSSLDENTTNEVMQIIASILGKTVIMVTHNLSEKFLRTFDEIVLMDSGCISISGTYDEVSLSPEFQKLIVNSSL